jgi:hypothetical protein
MVATDLAVLEALRLETRARGLRPTAQALDMPRTSLASVLAGTARPGTTALAIQRARRLNLGEVGKVTP